MPVREIIGKTVGFGLVAAALIAGGILELIGTHAYNEYFNVFIGWGLVGFGLVTGGYGAFAIAAIIYDAKVTKQEAEVHITPRGAPPAPPPPWGMGDIGRPGGGVVHVSGGPRGGGSPRVMAVSVSNIDGLMFIAGLLAWTVITLIFFAPTK